MSIRNSELRINADKTQSFIYRGTECLRTSIELVTDGFDQGYVLTYSENPDFPGPGVDLLDQKVTEEFTTEKEAVQRSKELILQWCHHILLCEDEKESSDQASDFLLS